MEPLQCSAVFPIIFWGMLLIFGRQRETGQANGRWQAVLIFTTSMGEGRGEKELSALPRNMTSRWCEQNSFGTCWRMEGWTGMAGPVYIPYC